MIFVAKAVLAAGLLLGAAQADAAVIFSFAEVGPATNRLGETTNLGFLGQVVFNDEAASRQGASLSRRFETTNSSSLNGLTALNVAGGNLTGLTLANFTTPSPSPAITPSSSIVSFGLRGDAMTGLSGSISYLNPGTEFTLSFAGTTFTGTYGSDSGICGGQTNGDCTFAGTVTTTQTATPIPEPASMALLGMGLAGMGLVRRKRHT